MLTFMFGCGPQEKIVELIAQTRPEIPSANNITAARTAGAASGGDNKGGPPPPSPSPLGTRMVEGYPEPIEPFYIYLASDNEVRERGGERSPASRI